MDDFVNPFADSPASAMKGAPPGVPWFVPPAFRDLKQQLLPNGLLRAWREALEWTQEQMLIKIQQYTKSDKPDLKTYQRWEQGKTLPHTRNFLALRQMLLDHGKYCALACAQFNLGDFMAVQWRFVGLKREAIDQWVLVNPKTCQAVRRVISKPWKEIEDNAFKEALELAKPWRLVDGPVIGARPDYYDSSALSIPVSPTYRVTFHSGSELERTNSIENNQRQ